MRMLLKIQIDSETGSSGIREGRMPSNLKAIIETLKPETVYFYVEGGKRTGLIIFDLKDAADLPVVTEPFFHMNCSVQLTPVMVTQDLVAAFAPASAGQDVKLESLELAGESRAGGSRVQAALAKFKIGDSPPAGRG
jgi:hypothetical protein